MLVDRQDLLYAFRSVRRTPLLTLVVVLALSVGIGLNAGVFTILNAIFLEPPTKQQPSSYAQIYPRYEGWYIGPARSSSFNSDDYDAIRSQSHSLADVAAWQTIETTLDDVRRQDDAILITCNYFRVLGIDRPLMGRFFRPEDCNPGTHVRIAVLSEHLWRDSYSADPLIVGKVIHISHQPLTVVGVASDRSGNALAGALLIPYSLQPAFSHGNSAFQSVNWAWLTVAGRLRQGYSRADAKAELQTILRQRDRFYLEQKTITLDRKTSLVVTNGSFLENPAMQSLTITLMALIMGPLALVLLLACTNVTMLFLSRSIVRRGELAIRLALGAGRSRLMRMLAIESLFTATVAGLISIYLAARIPILLFAAIDPTHASLALSIQPDWKVFGYLAALVLIATAASALAPMRESFRFDLITALKGREGAATMRSKTTSALIVVQLAMSFVLLAAAVLFARLPSTITKTDPGFETHQTISVPLEIATPAYSRTSALAFYRSLESRVLQVPGVQSIAYESVAPFTVPPISEVRLANETKGQGRPASIDNVSTDFFSTFGITMLRGRPFLRSDVSAFSGTQVAVVSGAFAKAFWGNDDPLGKVVVTPDGRHLVVVGVARDTRSEQFSFLDGSRLYTLRDPQSFDGQFFVRFFEDLQEQLPRVLEPVPPDIAGIVSDPEWYARAEHWWETGTDSDGRWDTWYDATEWWHQRELDTSYLINGPSFHMWRIENAVFVRWQPTGENPEGLWSTPDGQIAVNAESFESAAYSFFAQVLGLMRERVENIQAQGWSRKDCRLDIPLLLKEQEQRTTWVNALKGRRTQTDWDNARSLLDRLSSEMQS